MLEYDLVLWPRYSILSLRRAKRHPKTLHIKIIKCLEWRWQSYSKLFQVPLGFQGIYSPGKIFPSNRPSYLLNYLKWLSKTITCPPKYMIPWPHLSFSTKNNQLVDSISQIHTTVSKCIVEYASFQAWHSTHCVLVSAFLFNVSMKNGPKLFSKLCSLLIPRFIVWNFEYRPCPIIENPHGVFQFPCQCAHFSAVHWVLMIIINFAVKAKNGWKCQKFFVTTWLMPVENNRCH